MVDSLVRRTPRPRASPATGEARAAKIVADEVYPALDRQIAAMTRAAPDDAQPGDGVWRVPQGDDIYAAALAEATTTSFTPDEIHQIGLAAGRRDQRRARHDPARRRATPAARSASG